MNSAYRFFESYLLYAVHERLNFVLVCRRHQRAAFEFTHNCLPGEEGNRADGGLPLERVLPSGRRIVFKGTSRTCREAAGGQSCQRMLETAWTVYENA